MAERMHPVYTLIPQRSWDAIVDQKTPTLERVLQALAVDPLEAADIAEEGAPIDASFAMFASDGRLTQALQTASQWTMQQENARQALKGIAAWSHRLSVWCGCRVARTALRFVPASEKRPLRAIETAEAWVIGRATVKQARLARDAARAAVTPFSRAAFDAATRAASIAVSAIFGLATTLVVGSVADAVSVGTIRDPVPVLAREAVHAAELVRLREVVADACLTFPVRALGLPRSSGAVGVGSMLTAVVAGAVVGAGVVHLAKQR